MRRVRWGTTAGRWVGALACSASSAAAVACGPSRAAPADADAGALAAETVHHRRISADPLEALHAFEERRRQAADLAKLPASDRSLGPDPIAVRAIPGREPPRFVGLLRGRSALVLLDGALHELARVEAPSFPTGLAVTEDGTIAVSGEQSPTVAIFAVEHDKIEAKDRLVLDPRSHGLRDVAIGSAGGGRTVYAVDERQGTLLAQARGGKTHTISACKGPFRVAVAGGALLVDCLLDHRLLVFDLGPDGAPFGAPRAVIHHDGPMWGFEARDTPTGLLVAIGGVEDHVLDRTEGSFGFIDSFVFLYRVPRDGPPEELAAVNVSEHGVLTPKAISLKVEPDGGATVLAAGYGSDRVARLAWPSDLSAAPVVKELVALPGVASMALVGDTLVMANPLFDTWMTISATEGGIAREPVPVPESNVPPRSGLSRVGEALFFTNLMSPWNHSDGRLSRFTCETCHFEGYVDGRTHDTGRDDIRATTKPLLGLFNNRPYFSRALDPDLTVMVNNEFRAAGANSGHDPWFSAAETKLPWIARLGVPMAELGAAGLRSALMTFFMDFTHRPNTSSIGRSAFDDVERRGAAVFERTCERCHQARLSTDEPATRKPLAQWEALVLTREGPLVWASTDYQKTGVTPYVHELGARPPSLRRLYKKWPYFTNGSAKSISDVLARARWRGDGFWHAAAPADATGLTSDEATALAAFLDLL